MKNIVILTAKLLFEILAFIRLFLWRSFVKKSKSFHKLYMDKTRFYHFNSKGDIPAILYSRMPMRHVGRSFEYRTIAQFLSTVKKDFIVLDIGANVGLYTLLLSDLVGAGGKVISFEPAKDTFETLLKNIKYNNCLNVKSYKLALAETNGVLSLVTPEIARGKYEDSFKTLNMKLGIETKDAELVETKTLDSFMLENQVTKIDFIKIDVEGAELFIFKGAENLLKSSYKPIILFECAEELAAQFDVTVADSIILLKKYGYKLTQYEHNQWLALP
jgi:FkbM family methyltransferase